MTECWIIELTDRAGVHSYTSVVAKFAHISAEIDRCAKVFGERFLTANIHHWQRPNANWIKREEFAWRG